MVAAAYDWRVSYKLFSPVVSALGAERPCLRGYILIPDVRMFAYKLLHHVKALARVDNMRLNTFKVQNVFAAEKRLVLAYDHALHIVQDGEPGAIYAGTQRSILLVSFAQSP